MHELWGSPLARLIVVAFFGAAVTLLYPVMRGLRGRIEGRGREDVERLRADVEALRAEVARLRDEAAGGPSHERLTEIEERMDFAERLLASGRGTPVAREE